MILKDIYGITYILICIFLEMYVNNFIYSLATCAISRKINETFKSSLKTFLLISHRNTQIVFYFLILEQNFSHFIFI